MYTQIFDGLRSYYLKFNSRRSAAGYHAAMTMSFLFCVNFGAIITLTDCMLHNNLKWATFFFENKALLILLGIGVAYAHVQFGKLTGRYNSIEPADSARWKLYIMLYAGVSILMVVGAVAVSLLK